MGYYINPPDGSSKEHWLHNNAREVSPRELAAFDFSGPDLPICLVDNGFFTAAGICYCPEELEVFQHDDGREKKWFVATKQSLEPFYEE